MTEAPLNADVVVVGAGPAGAATAYHLAQAGADVVLLEKASFPRDKICGDGLTPRAVKQLIGMHGGQVGVHSEGSGTGARFELRLPLMDARALRAVPAA